MEYFVKMGLCADSECGQKILSYVQYFYAIFNDLFGFEKPACVARGALFFGLVAIFWSILEIPLVFSALLAYVAHYHVGGDKQLTVLWRTLGRDLR